MLYARLPLPRGLRPKTKKRPTMNGQQIKDNTERVRCTPDLGAVNVQHEAEVIRDQVRHFALTVLPSVNTAAAHGKHLGKFALAQA
jgi:hypothetical protein